MPFDTLHVPLHPNIYIYTHTHTHTPSHSLARTCTITDLETHVTCLLPWQPSDDGGAPPRSPFCSPAYVSPCTWVLTRLVHRSLIPTSPMVLSGIGALGTNLPRLVTRNPNPHSMEGSSPRPSPAPGPLLFIIHVLSLSLHTHTPWSGTSSLSRVLNQSIRLWSSLEIPSTPPPPHPDTHNPHRPPPPPSP